MRWQWKSVLRLSSLLLAGLVVVLLIVTAVAYFLYYRSEAAALPCRGCSGEARAVHVNGFDLYYRSVGERSDRPPVVLLHGGPGMSSQTFKKTFDFLAKSGFEVNYYDQRGSGNSQIRPEASHYTIGLLVEELEALRQEVIQADRITIIGHSAGGALAQRYALTYPEHVAKLVLVCALPANGNMPNSGPARDAVLSLPYLLSGNLPPADPEQADRWFADLSYRTSLPRLYDPTHPETLRGFGYVSFAVNRELTRSTFGGDFDERLRQLDVETMIIYGEADRSSFTGVKMAEQLHSIIPKSTLVGFERSGHWPYLEEPERFQQVLHDFLSRGGASR